MKGEDRPSFLEMIRAEFLFAIVVPLVSGTLISVSISGSFNTAGFLLVFVTGISLHISTNVYNDIYDTKQGADSCESKKSEYSGGSGIMIERPELMSRMFLIARSGIVVGVISTISLMFFIDKRLWIPLWIVIGTCIFLSKYYTAEPVKFAYRGLGELVVVIGFGPLAVTLAGLGQNLGLHPVLLSISPVTGLGTLFIVWMGEMVDLPTDVKGEKIGLVARIGFERARYGLVAIHSLALLNVVTVAYIILNPGWPLLITLVPFVLLMPKVWKRMKSMDGYGQEVKEVSSLNFKLYALFSLFLMLGCGLDLFFSFYL